VETIVTYTLLAVASVLLAIILDLFILKSRILATGRFWFAWAILVFFQLISNGWLTGRKIVQYDEAMIIGPRLGYAPLEDLLFGFALIVATIATWEKLRGVGQKPTPR